MSQHTILCPPPPRTDEGGFIFFVEVFSIAPKNVLKGKPEYFGVVQVKRPKKMFFTAYSLKPNIDNTTLFDYID